MTESKKWVVTTSGDRPLSEIEKELAEDGFRVEETYDALGILRGSADRDEVVAKAKKIKGVADVSPDPPPIDIGPPGAPETW